MANIKSSIKRARKANVRTFRNAIYKSKVKTAIKNFESAVQNNDVEAAKTSLYKAIKLIDKAAAKGLFHKNNAANKKSRITKMYNKIAG